MWQILIISNILPILVQIRVTEHGKEEARAGHRPLGEGWPTLLLWQSESPYRPLGQRCHRSQLYLPEEPQHLRRQALP